MGVDSCFSEKGSGLRITTHYFDRAELMLLCELLHRKYSIETSMRRSCHGDQTLYIKENSAERWATLVQSFMLDSITYKLGKYKKGNL
jgi:hypothetical protein